MASPAVDTSRNPAPSRPRRVRPLRVPRAEARRQLLYELISGVSGLVLALFMWGHMVMVGSILTGERGFDWIATQLEHYYVAQPTIVAISVLFLAHAVMASRKIPAQLRERRRMRALARGLKAPAAAPTAQALRLRPHLESMLWIWQVRTGMLILVLGSFHLVLIGIDLFTSLYGERVGIEAASTVARVGGGLWVLYGVLLVAVEFHASVGLYRLAVKWGVGSYLSRRTLLALERVIFVVFLVLGLVTLAVMAGWLPAPLAFLLEGA